MKNIMFFILTLSLSTICTYANDIQYDCCPIDKTMDSITLEEDEALKTLHTQLAGEWNSISIDGSQKEIEWIINSNGTFTKQNDLWAVTGKWSYDYTNDEIKFSFKDADGSQIENWNVKILDIDYHTAKLAKKDSGKSDIFYLQKI